MNVLIIIDMQKASFIAQKYNTRSVINNIKTLAEYFRKNSWPIIHIRHEDQSYKKDSIGWEFIDDLQPLVGERVIAKSCCDAFINSSLQETLQTLGATTLTTVGCATDFCVDGTIKGALHKGYNVLVASDAHTTGDRPQLTAKDVVDFFNWNWPLQLTGNVSLNVYTTTSLISSLKG